MNEIQLRDGWALFLILGICGCLAWGLRPAAEPPHAVEESSAVPQPSIMEPFGTDELGDRIADWKEARGKIGSLISKLERDRFDLLRQLERRGVMSTGEAAADPHAKVLLGELRAVLTQQAHLRRKHDEYDLALAKAEARQRAIQRRVAADDVGISEAELADLARSTIDLDESVAIEAETDLPVELDRMLAAQLPGRQSATLKRPRTE